MGMTAVDRVKRKTFKFGKKKIGGYDVFWYVHKLWMVAIGLLWLHAPRYEIQWTLNVYVQTLNNCCVVIHQFRFWIWSFWPLLLFFLEKLLRRVRSKEPTKLVKVVQEQGTQLRSLNRVFLLRRCSRNCHEEKRFPLQGRTILVFELPYNFQGIPSFHPNFCTWGSIFQLPHKMPRGLDKSSSRLFESKQFAS